MAFVFRTLHDYFPIAEHNGWLYMGYNVNEGVVNPDTSVISFLFPEAKVEGNKNNITWVEGIQLASIAVCITYYMYSM